MLQESLPHTAFFSSLERVIHFGITWSLELPKRVFSVRACTGCTILPVCWPTAKSGSRSWCFLGGKHLLSPLFPNSYYSHHPISLFVSCLVYHSLLKKMSNFQSPCLIPSYLQAILHIATRLLFLLSKTPRNSQNMTRFQYLSLAFKLFSQLSSSIFSPFISHHSSSHSFHSRQTSYLSIQAIFPFWSAMFSHAVLQGPAYVLFLLEGF